MPDAPHRQPVDGVNPPVDLAVDRREFVNGLLAACAAATPVLIGVIRVPGASAQEGAPPGYRAEDHYYGMGVDPGRCIGCARCVAACKTENDVPAEPHYFNTWIERYVIHTNGEVEVDSPNGGLDGFPPIQSERDILRTFFVPKLCNHCANQIGRAHV